MASQLIWLSAQYHSTCKGWTILTLSCSHKAPVKIKIGFYCDLPCNRAGKKVALPGLGHGILLSITNPLRWCQPYKMKQKDNNAAPFDHSTRTGGSFQPQVSHLVGHIRLKPICTEVGGELLTAFLSGHRPANSREFFDKAERERKEV